MRVLFAASEAVPFIKSGGLADVIGALPKEMAKKGIEPIVVLPKYQDINLNDELEYVTSYDIYIGWRKLYCGVFKMERDGVTYYLIDNEMYYKRPGLYGYHDDNERFAYFDFAVLELISHLNLDIDVLHLHDWQTAMISMLYKERYCYFPGYEDIKVVFTIHNIAYQGKCDPKLLTDLFGLDSYLYYNGNARHDGCLNMMKAAIVYSDVITTVSPTYAQEILTPEFGEGLDTVLELRKYDLYGILNGIDYDINNPATDPNIIANYDVETVKTQKIKNKLELQAEVGLEQDVAMPLIGIVTRLTRQKGLDIILNKIDEIMKEETQVVILGAGDQNYEDALKDVASKYPGRLALQLKYDFGLSCRIYAGTDMFLMPSLFEPCGLSQMMALRYGSVPIVRETGGLKDSVPAYDEESNTGLGFSFVNFNAEEMHDTIRYALHVYYNDKEAWDEIVERGMKTKLDWDRSADEYIKIFQSLL